MDFSKKLYALRKQKGLSQEELANHLEVTRQTVSKWELGDSTPDLEKLVLLAELFEISLDELVLDKFPVTTKLDELGAKVMTKENKRKAMKGLKIFGIIACAVLAIDVISMLIYFLCWGLPK
jgi:transcriptional regulator with XRE-family HTH domain